LANACLWNEPFDPVKTMISRNSQMNRMVATALAWATLAFATAVCAAPAPAPAPDPTDFMAQMTAFAESCGSRFPELAETAALLLASMEPDDRKLYEDTRRGPGFDAALVRARAQVANAPIEEQRNVCKALHDGLKKP
jgi:hypothetical protein